MKEFSKAEKAAIKRTAASVDSYVQKKNKLQAKIDALMLELEGIKNTLKVLDTTPFITGGYTSEDIVEKVVTLTGKEDKNGNPIKVTTYVFKYPETIIPVTENEVEDVTEEVTEVEQNSNEEPFIF
jgi:hypothetical protein